VSERLSVVCTVRVVSNVYKFGRREPILPHHDLQLGTEIAAKLQFGSREWSQAEVGTVIAKGESEQEG